MPSETEVSAILARFPGPVTLYPSHRKWVLMLAMSLLFAATGLWMIEDNQQGGWLVLIFFGIGVIASVAVLLVHVNALTLDSGGFEIKTVFRPGRVSWQNATDFVAAGIPPSGIKLVVFNVVNLDDPAVSKAAGGLVGLSKAAGRLVGIDRSGGLPDTYGLSADDLASLMTQWRERATS